PVNALTESDGRMISDGPVIETDNYEVSYLDNSVTLEFSLLDFNSPRNIIYEYRINNGRWLQTREGENSVQLSHLQPGTYQIEVRALSAGVRSETKNIIVEVTPPWYRSGWAYMIYLLGVIGIVGMMGWMWKRSANQQLDEEKMKFLINATHDIRSPLTLIMGGVGKLKNLKIKELKNEAEVQALYDTTIQPSIEAIDRNAQRLMLLVNQILDERRIDKHQMQLHCRETNMVDFISGICKLYQYNASQRNITFTFEHDKDHVLAWVDRIHFDKVVSNLLSNAFKYTFDGGEVKVVLREQEKDIEIKVVDSGTGIKEEDKERLFTRFYQGRNSDDLGMQGTGIGLNLSLAIAQLHGGKIKADNRSDGQGACFTVTLPKGNSHLKPDQIVTDSPAREVLSDGNGDKRRFRQFKILVVDDDQEIADYIINELGSRYKFNHAPNGKEGLKMLLTEDYDLVVSDVMMPEMDGLTLLKRIKDNPQISEIPVIMLTSKAEVEHKLEGLKSGADAYIAKPFSMEELHIQIDNLIDNVRRLRGKFSGAVQQEKRVENIEVKSNDDALMERVMRSVNAHLSDPDFNIDALASDVGISRAQLHRKMKEITGISSGKFLRNLRMEQAARLLREGAVNVSQVADRVGYDDRAHFSTAFKAHFGQSPTEYAESCKDK
ncbi:MAG: response regulator, partial [Prevotella sp.]|nr:response regulator [Prevotella sp.]